MSLRVWLPLNGDLYNQGLDGDLEITQIGSPTWDASGKIGKAMKFGDGTSSKQANGLFINNNLVDLLANDYSIAVWVNPSGNHLHYNGTIFSSGDWNKVRYTFGLSQDNSKVDMFCNAHNTYVTCNVPINTWTHLACVRTSDGKISLYKNGEYVTYITRTDHPQSDATTAAIGRETYASGYFSFNGKLNDFRLYDHALSAKEIKEISKALVIHYPLDGVGANENLYTGAKIRDFAVSSTSNYNYYTMITSLTPGETYTFSAVVELDGTTDLRATIFNYKSGASQQGPMKHIIADGKTRDSWTFTAVTENIICYAGVAGTTKNVHAIYNDIKVEKGSKATPWIPAPSDPLYTKMDFDSTVVYDESGFGNDGTANNITMSSESPRYDQCAVFTNTNSSWIKVNENNWMAQGAPEYTINLWVNTSAWGNRIFSCTESGGFNLEGGTSGYVRNALHAYTNEAKTSTGYIYQNTELKYSDLSAGWHMITFTYDSTSKKSYIDGELHHTYNITSYGVHFNLNARLYLGCEANTANPSSPYFEGKESDFRFYYTALSPEDIKELYEVGMSIDNKQNIHTYEIDEAGAIGISKTGILTSKTEFIEEADDPDVHLYKSGEVTANHFYEE